MRTPGTLLLLLIVVVTISYPARTARVFVSVLPRPATPVTTAPVDRNADTAWRYAETAPFHAVLPKAVQQFAADDPDLAAGRVCGALGGTIGYVETPARADDAVHFLCRFEEPDVTMSVDFGELRRIPAN